MRNFCLSWLGIQLLMNSSIVISAEAKPDADAILKRIEAKPSPASSFSRFVMTIKKGSNGVEKSFDLSTLKVNESESYSLLEFTRPDKTKILSSLKLGADDDRWIKTQTGKAKRISSSAENKSFSQSHFSYADFKTDHKVEAKNEVVCELAPTCTVQYDGQAHYKIKSTAKNSNEEYPVVQFYVRTSDEVISKIEYFDQNGKVVKELLIENGKEVDGFYTPHTLTMRIPESGDSTVMKLIEVKYKDLNYKKSRFDKDLL